VESSIISKPHYMQSVLMTVQPFGTRITWTGGNILINQNASQLQCRDLNIPTQKAVQKHATIDTF